MTKHPKGAELTRQRDDMLAALKDLRSVLLADHGASGGLNSQSRERAFAIVTGAIAKADSDAMETT